MSGNVRNSATITIFSVFVMEKNQFFTQLPPKTVKVLRAYTDENQSDVI